ncbi:MAG TPA: type IVB secretion system protein IcmH/DotU [Pyrinomonadaceae bacterium]|nr:type IVB secretion system protein IcmH/DotU [Pyrinomonadaceae bacterium]
MSTARVQRPSSSPRQTQAPGTLIGLAAPVLELVLKLRTGVVAASTEVRPVVSDLLAQLDQSGRSLRCPAEQIDAIKFALVAFIDETVLSPSNDFPLRKEWEQLPLQLEYFGEHLAGVKFFERLDALLQQADDEGVDVVEVYYLCLLLGFKGKYNFYLLEEQLVSAIGNVAEYLRRAGRLKPNALSGHWFANDQPVLAREPLFPLWMKISASVGLVFLIVTYLIFFFVLRNDLNLVR